MSNMSIPSRVVSQLFMEVPKAVYKQAKKIGWIDFADNCFKNSDKVDKLATVVFDIAEMSQSAGARDVKRHTEVIYGIVMPFKQLSEQWIDRENFKFKLPEKGLVSNSLLLLASLSQFPFYLSRDLKLFSVPYASEIANSLGRYSLFQRRPFMILLTKPKDFFTFWASLASSIETIRADYKSYKAKENLGFEKQFLSDTSVLKHINNIGKMTLIYFGATSYNQSWFLAAAAVTNTVSLTQVLYK